MRPQTIHLMSPSLSSSVSETEMILALVLTGALRLHDVMHRKVFRIVLGTKYGNLCYYSL